MGQRERLTNKIKSIFRRVCCRNDEGKLDISMRFDAPVEDLEEGGIKQYRLEATQTVRNFVKILECTFL